MNKVNEFETDTDKNKRLKYQRFDDEANMHYRYPKDSSLVDDKESLLKFLQHHIDAQVPRLEELEQYFLGNNVTVLQKERRKEKYMADNRATHNFASYISTFIQGYTAGVPIKTEYQDTALTDTDEESIRKAEESNEINDNLQVLNRENEADEHNSELVLDQSIYGRAYELVYRSKDDKVRFVKLDVRETFVVYSNTVDKEPVAGVRHRQDFLDPEKMMIWVYTADEIVQFEWHKNKKDTLVEVKREATYFKGVQIIEYENNSKRQGDFENVLNLIDMYDSAQSDMANYSQDLNDAMLVIEGNVNLTVKQASDMKRGNILLLKPAMTPTGQHLPVKAYYIYKKYDVQGSEAYKSRIQNDIFLLSGVPNLLDDKFAGNQSGEALKMKLFGLAQKRATKERKFKKGLRNRYRLIRDILRTASEMDFDVEKLTITFTENIPRAISQEVEWFAKLGGELSMERMLSLLSFVENPKKEMQAMEREKLVSADELPDYRNYVDQDEDELLAEERKSGQVGIDDGETVE